MKKSFIIFVISLLSIFLISISVNAETDVDNSKYVPKVVTTEDFGYKMVFDSELARTAHKLSIDAYGIGLGPGDTALINFKNEGFVDIQENFVWDDDIINAGFYSNNFLVGVKTFHINGEEKHILAIAFRGTDADNLIEWIRDALTDLTFFETYGFHAGFYSSAIKSYQKLLTMEFPSLKNDDGSNMTFADYIGKGNSEGDKYSILVTGHSLGGAIANIFAGDILSMFEKRNVMCYTFASPIVATNDKARNYDAYNIFNIVNTEDIVPQVGVNVFGINGRRLGTDLRVTVTDSEENAHNCAVTYKKATELVIDDIDRLYDMAYRKKYTVVEDDIETVMDELHIVKPCSLDEGLFSGELGNVSLVVDNADVTINTDVITDGNVSTTSGSGYTRTLDVHSGNLKIGGNLIQSGNLNIGNAFIEVDGDYNKLGSCTMDGESGYFLINGDLNGQYGGGWSGNFTAKEGTLEVKGDVNQFTGYRAEGNHRMILSGAECQRVDMDANDGWGGPGIINNLEVINTSEGGVEFTGPAHVVGEIYHNENSKILSQNVVLTKNASISGVWNGDLSASNWISGKSCEINGNLQLNDCIGKESSISDNMIVNGELRISNNVVLSVSNGELEFDSCYIHGGSKLLFTGPAKMTVNGDFSLEAASTLDIGPADVIILGNFNKAGACIMEDNNGHFLIYGDLTDSSWNFTATAGVLEIKGNIIDFKNYKASGTHKLILSGTDGQKIDMTNGDVYWDTGEINILEVINTSEKGVDFTEYAYVIGELYAEASSKIVNGSNVIITKDACVRGVWNSDLTASGWKTDKPCEINGNLQINDYLSRESSINANLSVSGELNTWWNVTLSITTGDLEVGSCYIHGGSKLLFTGPAKMTVNGDFSLEAASTLDIGPADVIILGNFNKAGACIMEDNNGHFLIYGDLTDSSWNFTATAGVLEIKGNIIDFKNYKASGTHKLILSGTDGQKIDMTNGSGFWDTGEINFLQISNTSEEGIEFSDKANVLNIILQPLGTEIKGREYVMLQDKPAFVDYGKLNEVINVYNGNAENVIPTWLDYECYYNFMVEDNKAFTTAEKINSSSFTCNLYFRNDYDKSSAVVIVAFYDGDDRMVQMASKPVDVKTGKVDVAIEFENKSYSEHKIMVWDSLSNLNSLMAAK